MASKTEFVRSRIVKTYDLDEIEKLIQDAKVAHIMLTDPPPVVDEESVMTRLSALTLRGSDGMSCSCCGVGPFTSRAQQTAHYKHHWHTHNLKRKLFGRKPISLGEYNSRQDESSNVSASDSEGDDNPNTTATELFAAATRHCKAFYCNPKGQVFCIYRCLLHHRKEEMSLDGEGHVWARRVKELLSPGFGRWAVLMVSGGHFAGCIFTGGSDAIHKTLHSYTTRRGQGMAQSTRDQTGNAPKSAGASLRRYNQEQFLAHVQNILVGWNEDLKGCSLVFYRAVGAVNQAAIFGKPSPLRKEDPRVRQLPFPTRKPTFKEVKRVFQTLASIEVYDSLQDFQKALLSLSGGKVPVKTNSDVSIAERAKKAQKPPPKVFDRAKSRERAPRELPTQVTSSEDEGPCYIDSETPADWIKTLSEQSTNGVITNSRKDLLNDCAVASCVETDSESETVEKKELKKKKKTKKLEDKSSVTSVKKGPPKISANLRKMWRTIMDKDYTTLDTILEGWEGDIQAACNIQDPIDGNTALHKAAIAAKPEMVTQILSAGGDPCIKNYGLQTPYAATPHQDTRIAFRLFQAQHPDKYNYAKSQIPGPVTAEQLEQEKEKKAQQKKAKRQREKERQVDKLKAAKFLQLPDEMKKKVPVEEQRCFLCGNQLPKVPFEYDNCKFCQVPCLHSHRKIRPLNMSV
uniref:VLRF1 domain-containing protein n=1 Tax=Heliothis virescens TaxID=7102 RepID=A0A2A4JGB5_HELVI